MESKNTNASPILPRPRSFGAGSGQDRTGTHLNFQRLQFNQPQRFPAVIGREADEIYAGRFLD
jgi:hypothetical protein